MFFIVLTFWTRPALSYPGLPCPTPGLYIQSAIICRPPLLDSSTCYLPLLVQFSKSEIYKVNLRTWKITFVAFVLGIFLLKFDGPHLGGHEKNWRVAEKSSNPYPSNKWKPPKAKRIIGGLVAQKTDEIMQRFQCMKSTRPRLTMSIMTMKSQIP